MIIDPIADMFTCIRNASRAKHPTVLLRGSKTKKEILSVLQQEGYIHSFEEIKDGVKTQFRVHLRYLDNGEPVIKTLTRLSRPGRRVYIGTNEIPRIAGGLGTTIVSTSQGMLSERLAREKGVGGELICSIF